MFFSKSRVILAAALFSLVAGGTAFGASGGEQEGPGDQGNSGPIVGGKGMFGSKEGGIGDGSPEKQVWDKEFGAANKNYNANPTGEKPKTVNVGYIGKWHEQHGTGDVDPKLGGKNSPCSGGYHELAARGTFAVGVQHTDLDLHQNAAGQTVRANGQFASNMEKASNGNSFTCNAAVEGALINGNVECQGTLGSATQNVFAKAGAKAGAGGQLGCKCSFNGAKVGLECGASIGLTAGVEGTVGASLCSLTLGLTGGLEGQAGASLTGQAGYVEGKGYGLKFRAALGLGGGASFYLNPNLGGLFKGSTYVCLAKKATGVYAALKTALAQAGTAYAAAAASSGGGAFLMP